MKKIIFLVETNNANFLYLKRENKYILPFIICKNNFNLQKLSEKLKGKYNLEADDFVERDKTSKCILMKCRLQNEYDKKVYEADILKKIINNLSDKDQQKFVNNILDDIFLELLNDVFWLYIMINAAERINNEYFKTIIMSFNIFFSTIFVEETINYGFGEINSNSYTTKSQIKNARNYFLKDLPTFESKKNRKIINDMEIDFENYAFDICIYTICNNVFDINSRIWEENYQKNIELYGKIILSIKKWIGNLCPEIKKYFETFCQPLINNFIIQLNKINVKSKIYSTYKLLDKKLDDNSKLYILQRIGLLKTTMCISNLFFKKDYAYNVYHDKKIFLGFDKVLRKYKATIIEMLGKDENKVPLLHQVLGEISGKIEDDFFTINRKCRNNLHYGFYNSLSNKEIEVLDKYQDVYLNYVIGEFEKHIKYKPTLSYHILLGLAHLERWVNS